MIPAVLFTMSSPYFKALRESWRLNKRKLLDVTEQLTYILEETQTDVYNQFSENQSKWKQLAKYTVDKKKEAKSDRRILHESKTVGKRLKDAYAESGMVVDGHVIFTYPESKPYAREHQEGADIESNQPKKERPESEYKKRRRKARESQEKKLDLEYLRRMGLPDWMADLD